MPGAFAWLLLKGGAPEAAVGITLNAILCIRLGLLFMAIMPVSDRDKTVCQLSLNGCLYTAMQLAAAQQYCLSTAGYAPLHQWAKKHTWQMHAPPGDHDLIITPGNNQTIEARPHWLSGPSHAGRMLPAMLYLMHS